MDADIRDVIAKGVSEADLRIFLTDRGMVRLDADACQKVAAGITDLDEALRVRWLV